MYCFAVSFSLIQCCIVLFNLSNDLVVKEYGIQFLYFFLIWYWFLSVSVALIWTGFASLLLYLIWPNIIGQVKWIWPLLNFGWLNELAQPVVWVGQINRLMVLSQSTGHKVDSPYFYFVFAFCVCYMSKVANGVC